MPELPEVETIARGLDPLVRRRVIAKPEILWDRTVDSRSIPLETLRRDSIESVGRIGKFVAIRLRSGRTLTVHLRMTGRLTVTNAEAYVPYERLALVFEDGDKLSFADARKFGRIRLLDDVSSDVLGVGIDALSQSLDAAAFASIVRKRKTPVKTLLLDQKRIAGVGNIYANEALFRARIRPRRPAGRLSARERIALVAALRRVLLRAIESRGSSVDDYVDAEGLPGDFQKKLNVYGRAGLPCRRCRTPIKRIVLGQRGTFYCPACQR
ncbi:MAG: bifunctional DNA-formamidopyrimidine glycosylase/DNA-(apurinic or apyrimidinic site) lyase [Candidatus Eremiobacterales bacterium]